MLAECIDNDTLGYNYNDVQYITEKEETQNWEKQKEKNSERNKTLNGKSPDVNNFTNIRATGKIICLVCQWGGYLKDVVIDNLRKDLRSVKKNVSLNVLFPCH